MSDMYQLSPSQMMSAAAFLPLETLTPVQFDKVMEALREVAKDAFAAGRASYSSDVYMRSQLAKAEPTND